MKKQKVEAASEAGCNKMLGSALRDHISKPPTVTV